MLIGKVSQRIKLQLSSLKKKKKEEATAEAAAISIPCIIFSPHSLDDGEKVR